MLPLQTVELVTATARAARLEVLHHRFSTEIFARCLRLLRSRAEAEDAVQETFARAFRDLSTLTEPQAVLGWLQRIAANVSLNMIRSRRRRGETSLPTDGELAHAHGASSPVDELHWRRLWRALASELDPRTLAILIAHHLEGLSQGAIAADLGLSRRAVVKRLAKVRRWRQRSR